MSENSNRNTDIEEEIIAIENKIAMLKAEIDRLTAKEYMLIQKLEHQKTIFLQSLPTRVRNRLKLCGINSDFKLHFFLEGQKVVIDPPILSGIVERKYENANTPLERLLSLRQVGLGSAKESIRILQDSGFID